MDRVSAFPPQQEPTAAVLQLAAGFGISQALFVAAKIGIADLLSSGPRSVQEIARDAGLRSDVLYQLMRALASVGVFAEEGHEVFCNTSMSETFISASGSLRPFLVMSREPECWRPWGELLHSVQTGQPAFEHVYGRPFFDYLAAHAEPARVFDEGMASRNAAEIATVLSVYDFSNAGRIVDVGGGNGALLKEVLTKCQNVHGVVYDLPSVIDRAKNTAVEHMHGRLRFKSGDFFSKIPDGGDLYIMKKIIHDWPDDRAIQILHCCRKAMTPKSRLLLIELVLPRGDGAMFTKFLDLWMLIWPGGRERTKDEYEEVLGAAGLALARITPTNSAISIIEATPA